MRQIEFEQCDRLTCALWPKAQDGYVPAVRALFAVVDRRAQRFGLETRTQASVPAKAAGRSRSSIKTFQGEMHCGRRTV